jgi:Phosphatidylglycerol lysyltransferase, C-terminal
MAGLTSRKKILWINNPHYRYNLNSLKRSNKLFQHDPRVFISSCNESFASFFKGRNFEAIKTAKEAVLILNHDHFSRRSLINLIKRGLKHGSMREVEYALENKIKLDKFKFECAHGKEPQLKYFFKDEFEPQTRLFVFTSKDNQWFGAYLISNSGEKIYSHLLLRKSGAPTGTMEALTFSLFNKLKEEGFQTWSLGDVPFVIYDSSIFSKEFLINFLGRRLRFAYNYSGLYNFKNKFNPFWNDVYVCCRPKLDFKIFFNISLISNIFLLIINKFISLFSINNYL